MLLLVGSNDALLEGLAQALARTGQRVRVVLSLTEADEIRRLESPIMVVAERSLLAAGPASQAFLHGALNFGGALVTYRESGETAASPVLAPGLERLVLADLELPLERHRLVALAEHLATRARAVGRSPSVTPPESPAS